MEFIGNLSIVGLLAYGGALVMNGSVRPGELVAFFSLTSYLMWPIMNLGFVINMFSQSKASGERLLEILEEEEKSMSMPEVSLLMERSSFSMLAYPIQTRIKNRLRTYRFLLLKESSRFNREQLEPAKQA